MGGSECSDGDGAQEGGTRDDALGPFQPQRHCLRVRHAGIVRFLDPRQQEHASLRAESALTRGPSTASSARSTVSASVAASNATIAPAIPIEYRNGCGKIVSAVLRS